MKHHRLEDFYRGWIVGQFEPSLLKADFEVGIAHHHAGEPHQDHFHKLGTEINVVVSGTVKINDRVFTAGDIFILEPWEVSQAEFITDCVIVIVRDRSDPRDKYTFDVRTWVNGG